jgi:hypothetical protein
MQLRTFVYFLLALSVTAVHPVKAQFSLGINAGVTRMKFSGDPVAGLGRFAPQPGFSVGLRADYRFSDAISLSLQPGFSQLRSSYKVLNDSATETIDSTNLRYNTLSFPLHMIVWSESGRFYALAGMQFDFTMSLKGETVASPYASSYDIRDFTMYAQFGAGFILSLGKPYLYFELRYSQGIFDIKDPFIHQDSFLPRTKLTNISLIVGLQIPLGAYSEKYPLKKKNK